MIAKQDCLVVTEQYCCKASALLHFITRFIKFGNVCSVQCQGEISTAERIPSRSARFTRSVSYPAQPTVSGTGSTPLSVRTLTGWNRTKFVQAGVSTLVLSTAAIYLIIVFRKLTKADVQMSRGGGTNFPNISGFLSTIFSQQFKGVAPAMRK